MKFRSLLALLLAGSVMFSACSKDDDGGDPVDGSDVILKSGDVITGNYTGNVTLEKGTYTLSGYVYIENGGKLTIPAGTVIKSDITNKGALIIERGAKIMAEGTASQPIVFTSGQPDGQRKPGDWGGIIVLGKATTNRTSEPKIEGGVGSSYGGTDDSDNSGVMKYVRIEFAGIAAAPGSEINGLTLGAVGSGTTLEYIQVAYANDDAFEFFGGTVNAKHLIAYATADDDFDFDFGYRGKIQYGVALRDPSFVDPADDANGIECDNDGNGTAAEPFTKPVLSNFTFVGPNADLTTAKRHNAGNRFRRNASFVVNNSIMLGWVKAGLLLESNGAYEKFISGGSEFKNNLVHAIAAPFKIGTDVTVANASAAAMQQVAGITPSTIDAIKLTDPFKLNAPNFLPAAGSPALTGAAFDGVLASGFDKVTYKGAFGSTNWTSGWANFNFTKSASGGY